MATVSPATEQATDLLQNLSLNSQTKNLEVSKATKKNPSTIPYGSVDGSEVPHGTIPSFQRSTTPSLPDFMDPNICYLSNGYPSTTYYYGGYDGPTNEWEEYPRYVNSDGVEMPPAGVYGDCGSFMYQHVYGYAPYGAYPPAGSHVPTVGHDGQLYGPQHYQYAAPCYQPQTPSGAPYTYNQAASPQGELSTSVAADQVPLAVEKGNGNVNVYNTNGSVPLWPSYLNSLHTSNGSYGRGMLQGGVPASGYHDPRFGYDGIQSPVAWLDGSIFPDGHQGTTTSSVSCTVPSSRSQNLHPLPHLMGSHPRPTSGMGPTSGFMNSMYPNNKMYSQDRNMVRTDPGFTSNGFDSRTNKRGCLPDDNKYKPRGRGNGLFGCGNESADGLNELNRGPRAGRFKNQKWIAPNITIAVKGQNLSLNKNKDESGMVPDRDQYNRAEFLIKYSGAKFFVIKSYSEDDIHRSIKYNVWASTPNGNKKLNSAYQEAQDKSDGYPIFLFFSVNTSGQFVGLAEMVGPVDFNKNVEYWQQDKWNGCFPVKWHIVKDVPNSLLKHITLENNDNKPVTNSRDTQEVKFEQGLEMLKIFKAHVFKTYMLEDFAFYEARQKAIQERKVKPQQFQKQVLDGQPADAADGSDLKASLQNPLERTSVLNNEAGQGLEGQELSVENDLAAVTADATKVAKPAIEKMVDADGITDGC